MFRHTKWAVSMVAVFGVLTFAVGFADAQAKNPCNPCGGKGKASGKAVAVNPCHAKLGTVFHVTDPMNRNSVTFTSEAPLEDIVGTSSQVSGYIVFDPTSPKRGGRGVLSVPVASINTGIPLRDEHLQGPAWLDTAKYPNITFHIDDSKNVKAVSKTSTFQTYDLTLVGRFSLHGRDKEIEVPARITYMEESAKTLQKMPGNLLAGRATFTLRLADFGISGPPGMDIIGSKVGEAATVVVRFVASSQGPAENPCNPCGGKAKNPCNPCGGKAKNPCNPCNPCGPKKK